MDGSPHVHASHAEIGTTRCRRQGHPHHQSRDNGDLSDDLFDEFLDADRFYSCAYFEPGHDDL